MTPTYLLRMYLPPHSLIQFSDHFCLLFSTNLPSSVKQCRTYTDVYNMFPWHFSCLYMRVKHEDLVISTISLEDKLTGIKSTLHIDRGSMKLSKLFQFKELNSACVGTV